MTISSQPGFAEFASNDGNSVELEQRTFELERHFQNAAISVGTEYRFNDQRVTVKASRSYRMPSIAELASNGIHHGTFRHELGDPTLTEEIGYQADATYQINGSRWSLNAALFGSVFENYLYLAPTPRFSPLPESGQLFTYQSVEALFWGGELSIQKSLGKHWLVSTNLEAVFNRNQETGLGLPFTPPASVLNGLRYEGNVTKSTPFFVQLDYRYAFAQERVDQSEPITPSYHLLNVRTGIDFNLGRLEMTAQLAVQNFTNASYLLHTSRYRWINVPEQGRNIIFSLFSRLQFVKNSRNE